MTSKLEFEGRNVEKAIESAAKALKISKESLKYEIISHGSTGIFGLVGMKKAKIRLVNEKGPLEKAEAAHTDDDAGQQEERTKKAKPSKAKDEGGDESPDRERSEIIPNDVIESGEKLLQRIVTAIGEEGEISVSHTSGRIHYQVQTEKGGVLIGKHGQTLEAIQYIIEKVVNKNSGDRHRVSVDVEGYLEKRKNQLKRLAEKLSKTVKKTGKPATVGQMNAHDRRIIHLALKNDAAVHTQSVGSGYLRKIVIHTSRRQGHKSSEGQREIEQLEKSSQDGRGKSELS